MALLEPRIDHVVVNVLNDLDEAADRYRRLGFLLTERGHHTLGTSNNLAIFGDDYLELLGFERGKEGSRVDLVQTPPGLSGLVFKPPADPGFAAALNAAGVRADGPREFSRPVDLPGGAAEARFRTVNLPDALPNARVFFCHHHTPELVWRPEWRAHPNGVVAIDEVAVMSAEPVLSVRPFEAMFGDDRFGTVSGGLLCDAGTARLRFVMPSVLEREYGAALPPRDGEGDRMAVLVLRTRSIETTRAALRDGGVEGVTERRGALVVPAREACGVTLVFRA